MATNAEIQTLTNQLQGKSLDALSVPPSRWPKWARQTWDSMDVDRRPTAADAELVVLTAHQLLLLESESGLRFAHEQTERLRRSGNRVEPATLRRRAQKALIAGAGEYARRGVRDAFDRELVFKAVARVATKKSHGKTLIEQAAMVVRSSDSYKGHVFELMDQRAFNALKGASGKVIELCPEHNRKAIDGVYKVGGRTVGELQAKASRNPNYLARAAKGSVPKTRELVVTRDGKRVAERAVKGKMPVRASAVSDKDLSRALKKAKTTKKASQVGTAGALRATAQAAGGAAALGAAISVAGDARKLKQGDITKGRAAKRAGIAAAEGATCTALSAAAGAAAAPAIASGVTALVGSTVAGTTAAAAGLAVLGPIGITIGGGILVGSGFKKLRRALDEE